jgi:hypothetical protein
MRGRPFIPPALLWMSGVCVFGGAWANVAAARVTLAQLIDTSEQQYYVNVRSIVDWSPAELSEALPELKALKPAPSQEKLPLILRRLGENIEAFFQSVPNISCIEEITQDQLRPDGSAGKRLEQEFRYLVLAHREKSEINFEEYRTDGKGNRIEPQGLEGGFMLTRGFAAASLHFHPLLKSDSTFRYLGEQVVDGRETYVVAFAQRPGWAHLSGRVISSEVDPITESVRERSVLVLVQGIAWIDPVSFRCIRIRTDLLAPRLDIKLGRQSTDIYFGEVHFPRIVAPLWLPRQVIVTSEWRGRTFRNRHRYRDFKLFTVEIKIGPVEPDQKP